MKKHIENIIQWGNDRDLYTESTPLLQFQKYLEEKGELAKAVNKDNIELIKDAIGDSLVCLVHVGKFFDLRGFQKFNFNSKTKIGCLIGIDTRTKYLYNGLASDGDLVVGMVINEIYTYLCEFCQLYNITIEECLKHAWNEIKDRKGKFINGLYVKEEDLK